MVGRYGVLRNGLCPQHKHHVERDCFAQISNGRVVCSGEELVECLHSGHRVLALQRGYEVVPDVGFVE